MEDTPVDIVASRIIDEITSELAVCKQGLSSLEERGGVLTPSDESEHGASCECLACRTKKSLVTNSSRLVTLESSENSHPKPSSPIILPAQKDPCPLDDFSLASNFRHSGWQQDRRRVFTALKATEQTHARVSAFAACGSNMMILRSRETMKGPDGGHYHKYQIRCNCCHDRLCVPCARTRSLRIRESLMKLIEKKSVTFITLTLGGKNPDLTESVDRLYRHFKALRNHPVWSEAVKGGAAFCEVKWNAKASRWHPHLHIVCEAGFIPKDDLSRAWHSITKDSFIVDISKVRDEGTVGAYVTKYASKPMDGSFLRDTNLLQQAVLALKGRRLCLTFGDWYGTPLTAAEDEELADDLIDVGGYESWGTMNELLALALDGNSEGMHIIRSLDIYDRFVALTSPRPPPPAA